MKPECRKCKHFFVTYEPQTPNGCKAFQIKSKALPQIIVKQANQGQECLGFQEKVKKKKSKDLNDNSLW